MEKTQAEIELESKLNEVIQEKEKVIQENERLNKLIENKSIENSRKAKEAENYKNEYKQIEQKFEEFQKNFTSQIDEMVNQKLQQVNEIQLREKQTIERLTKLNVQNDAKSKQLIDLIGIEKISNLSDEEIVSTFGIKEIKEVEEKNEEEPQPQDKSGYDEDGFLME